MARVHAGADSYLVADGKIVGKSMRYTARDGNGERRYHAATWRADEPARTSGLVR